MSISTHHINYLERDFLVTMKDQDVINRNDFIYPKPNSLQFIRIHGISRFWEYRGAIKGLAHYLQEDILVGLKGVQLPIIYLILGNPSELNIYMGIWDSNLIQESENKISGDLSTLKASLQSAYPGIELEIQSPKKNNLIQSQMDKFRFAGTITGTPTIKYAVEARGIEQIERLIRGLYGSTWGYLVMASPIFTEEIESLQSAILNELRSIENEVKSSGATSFSNKYRELLEIFAKKIETGNTLGLWYSSTHIFTKENSLFHQAKSVANAVFGGKESLPDPIRVIDCHNWNEQLRKWGLNIKPAPDSQGKIKYPYKFLSILNSRELGCLIHLPMEESPGFLIKDFAQFDVSKRKYDRKYKSIKLGNVVNYDREMGYEYEYDLSNLDRHCLIAGMTGSGKTNSVFHILQQVWKDHNIPFMVIEPAKTEYRKLLYSEIGTDLQIFTLQREQVSPFRINPFEIMPNVSVQTHIDLLKSVFNASFIMYAPMPYVLERCIHEIYEDKGWNLITSKNSRGLHKDAQPTLTDLYLKVDEVVDRLGYETRITMDVKAALKTRINSLRIGGKGMMLDTKQSIPMDVLLQKPTVLELEQVGDDDDKAFIMGLMLVFLYEYYVTKGIGKNVKLQHLTIVEEAHRLLENVPIYIDTETANMKGKAVETFCNILSEVRAYGEGILVVEQIPSKLALDVIKNTNLKVMHRITAMDDREIMGASMNMREDQDRRVASLKVGDAAVYCEGEDNPILVHFGKVNFDEPPFSKEKENKKIINIMEPIKNNISHVFMPIGINEITPESFVEHKAIVDNIVDNIEFREVLAQYILSAVVEENTLLQGFYEVVNSINRVKKPGKENDNLLKFTLARGIDTYFEQKGQEYGWLYKDIDQLKSLLNRLIIKYSLPKFIAGDDSEKPGEVTKILDAFEKRYLQLCKVQNYPYPGCEKVCNNQLCLYRYNVKPLVSDKHLHKNFISALSSKNDIDDISKELFEVCSFAVRRVISNYVSPKVKWMIGLCFAIQKSETLMYMDRFDRGRLIKSMLSGEST